MIGVLSRVAARSRGGQRCLHTFCGTLLVLFSLALPTPGADALPNTPVITTFSPASAYPGTLVLINGSNLVQVSSIQFGDVAAPVYGGVDDGTIVQTEVPAGASTGPVTVVTASGTATSVQDFEVLGIPGPNITRFSPTSGSVGALVQFDGTGLINVTNVSFNGVDSLFVTIAGLAAFVPTNATTGSITVSTKQGSFTTTNDFVVTAAQPPAIASFSPRNGYPGTSVTITGANLVHVRSVSFGGVASDSVTSMVETTLWATVPTGAQNGPITVVTDAGVATSSDNFTVTLTPAPVIDRMSPTTARPGDLVLLSGNDFLPSPIVTLSGVRAELHALGATDLWFVVPYALSGPVSVTTAGGTGTTEQILTVISGPPEPELVGFGPANGLVGSSIAIQGHNLGNIREVLFNGTRSSFQQYGHEQIVAIVPPLATPGPIQVETEARTLKSATPFYVFNSGHLSVVTTATLSTTSAVAQATFSTTITNLGAVAVQQLGLTNWLGATPGQSADLLAWNSGYPSLNTELPTDVEIARVAMSQGTSVIGTNAVVLALGPLEPGASCSVTIEVRTQSHQFLHHLAAATGVDSAGAPVSGGALASVDNGIHLSIQAMNNSELLILWPFTDPPMTLEVTDTFGPATIWSPSTAEVTPTDGLNSVHVPIDAESRFYRLVQKP
jgi:hypothetical protein